MMPIGQVFESFSRSGFTGAEVMVTSEKATQDPKALNALAEDFGVHIGAIHAPFLLLTRQVFTTDPLEKIRRSTEVAHGCGAPLVVVHPAYRWQFGYNSWLEKDIKDFNQSEELTVAGAPCRALWIALVMP